MASTVWRGNIAFGLVSIPVRLVRAARRERVQFRQVYKTERSEPAPDNDVEMGGAASEETDELAPVAPVQRVHTALTPAEPSDDINGIIRPAEILKGFEVEPNRYVTFKPDEVKAIKLKTSTTIEIGSFIHLEEIDPIYFDASYYIVPQPAGEKPYSILFGALAHSKFTALGQMAMHGREHAIVIRNGASGLILETLFYQNEVHVEDQFAVDTKLAAPAELKMAEAFIQAMTAEFNPSELVDQYEKRIKAMIDSRAASAAPDKTEKPQATAPVVDIMEALRKSLEQARKPASTETRSTPSHAKTRTKEAHTKRKRAS